MKTGGGRLYVYTVSSLSVAMLAAGVALLIVMLANVIGPFRFGALDPDDAPRAIGFWLPVAGDRPFPPAIARRTEAWRQLLDGSDDVVVESHRLRDLLNAGVGTVLLPDARQLEPGQARALERYMADGGGVVVSGSIGVRGPDDIWLGYGTMRSLLRVAAVAPLAETQSGAVAAHRRGPLSARLGPGEVIRLVAEPGVPAIDGGSEELVWSDASGAVGSPAGAAHRVRLGRGRLAWVGPGPEVAWVADQEERRALERTLQNALAWVRRRPVLELRAWPGGAPFAASLLQRAPDASPRDTTGRDAMERALFASVERARRTGEHVRLEIPALAGADRWAEAVRTRLLERLDGLGAWLATPDQAADWVAQRAAIRIGLETAGPNRVRVDVTHTGAEKARGIGLRLWVNRPAASIEVGAVILGQTLPELHFDRAREAAELLLPPLDPGATSTFTLDFDDPDFENAGFDDTAGLRSG